MTTPTDCLENPEDWLWNEDFRRRAAYLRGHLGPTSLLSPSSISHASALSTCHQGGAAIHRPYCRRSRDTLAGPRRRDPSAS